MRRLLPVGLAVLLLLPAAAHADGIAWEDSYSGVGKATVFSDLVRSRVCDLDARDGVKVGLKYATSMTRIIELEAPQGGCEDDRVWLGSITHARLCTGPSFGSGFPSDCQASATFN